jgi:hypothetical protein
MTDLTLFAQYDQLATLLIEQATKEQLAECARLLARNLAHHQSLHGEIPLDDTLAMLDAATPNAAQAEMLTEGMINLIGMLGNVCSGLGEAKH